MAGQLILLGAAPLGVVLYVLYMFVTRSRKAAVRPHGYCFPDPEPLLDLTPETLRQHNDRPWRPFRWPYHQTMSLLKLPPNHWLDMDMWYWRYFEEKQTELSQRGKDVFDCLPDGEEPSRELLLMAGDFLIKRYPRLFERRGRAGICNLITGETFADLRTTAEHPLLVLSRLAKEDFYIVRQRDDGQHYMVAGCVPFPGGFTISTKMGRCLNDIHKPVAQFESKLRPSMERYFGKMDANKPIERASFFITWDYGLYESVLGYSNKESSADGVPYDKFVVRVERQTLRRLPRTRAIVFSNHPVFYRICDMQDEPGIPSILIKFITEAPGEIMEYKDVHTYRDHLLPYLKSLEQRQYDLGIIPQDYVPATRPDYPFKDGFKSNL